MDNIETRERRRLLENCWAAGFFILLILLKQAMVGRLPAVVYADSPHDDLWVVKAAESLLEGQWLGVYNQYTLIKGAFSAMVMAFARWTGATYIGLNTLLYSLACLTFVSAIRPLFRRSWPLYITFIVLLFNPLTYAAETWQRIYRNGMSQWQVLFIFGALLAIFLRRKDPVRKLIPWALLGGCSLWAFNYTREDSVWILPFAFGAPVIMIIMILIERKEVRCVVRLGVSS
jgi:hypothetical protein